MVLGGGAARGMPRVRVGPQRHAPHKGQGPLRLRLKATILGGVNTHHALGDLQRAADVAVRLHPVTAGTATAANLRTGYGGSPAKMSRP